MNTDKLAINWQNFAQVGLQLKFANILVRTLYLYAETCNELAVPISPQRFAKVAQLHVRRFRSLFKNFWRELLPP